MVQVTVPRKRVLFDYCKVLSDTLADLIAKDNLTMFEVTKIWSSLLAHSINALLNTAGMSFDRYDAFRDLLEKDTTNGQP